MMIYTAFCVLGSAIALPAADTSVFYENKYTQEELEVLLEPIALYPDPLLAQLLPASTFINQIDEAARYLRRYGRLARIDQQPWDVSVKAIAHYPQLLFMMDRKYDWTISLGMAFLYQQQDVLDTIQELRSRAMAMGNLVTTSQQQVVVQDGTIFIIPAEPATIYIPDYDPSAVYFESPPQWQTFITFGIGFSIGAWLNRDCDWSRHRIYYHGWQGGGWIGRSRPHVNVRNNIYVNNRYSSITINKNIVNQDPAPYREQMRREIRIQRKRNQVVIPSTQTNRGRTSPGRTPARQLDPSAAAPNRTTGKGSVTARPAPATPAVRAPAAPTTQDVFRGRDTEKRQPASRSAYGGYGTGREAATYRERGKASQERMRRPARPTSAVPAPTRPPAPAQRSAPAGSPIRPGSPAVRAPSSEPAVKPAPRTTPAPHQPEAGDRKRH